MHANVYLVLKTDGPLHEKLMSWTTDHGSRLPHVLRGGERHDASRLPSHRGGFPPAPLDPWPTLPRWATGDVQHPARDPEKTPRTRFREFLRGARASFPSVRRRCLSEPGFLDPEPCV